MKSHPPSFVLTLQHSTLLSNMLNLTPLISPLTSLISPHTSSFYSSLRSILSHTPLICPHTSTFNSSLRDISKSHPPPICTHTSTFNSTLNYVKSHPHSFVLTPRLSTLLSDLLSIILNLTPLISPLTSLISPHFEFQFFSPDFFKSHPPHLFTHLRLSTLLSEISLNPTPSHLYSHFDIHFYSQLY